MSKSILQRKRQRRIRRIVKRIRRGAVVVVVIVGIVCIRTTAVERRAETVAVESVDIIREPIPAGQQDAPRKYGDVPFVALPVPMTDGDQETVFRICQEYGVAFPLVMAIIETESAFDRTARSTTGDSGYMQINDVDAESLAEIGFADLYDLEQNVGAGVYILSNLFSKYDGDCAFVLMAYNAGERGAREMRERGINETEYTEKVMSRADSFTSYIDDALTE